MESNRTQLIAEMGRRATFMARQIAEMNAPHLAAHAETKTEIGMVENAEGVRIALLADLDSRIIAPSSKFNQYLSSGVEAIALTRARDLFRSGRETGLVREIDSSLVAIEPVKVLNPALGKNVVVAMAVVSIDTSISTPDLGEVSVVYSETLILTGILAALLLFILYRLTLKPYEILNEDLDKALKGEISQVTHEFKLEEMNPLWDIINSAIQRIPKANESSLDGLGGGDNSQWMEECVGPMRTLGGFVKFGIVVFDSNQKILYLNPMFEEISGIREDGAIGHQMSEVGRDQAMGAFSSDLLGRAPVGGDGISEDFDFSGVTYKVYAAAFGRSGQSAKGFILSAVKAEM
jgi:PAS domain-containing protein